ncbi:MAG: Mov34/MPN/PAD-1 family protein [Polyangiales bacterium]
MIRQARGFRRVRVTPEPVHTTSRADAFTGVRRFVAADGFTVTIHETVIERLTVLGKNALPNETYGLLVGRRCCDDVGEHVVIIGIVHDEDAHAGPGHVRTSVASEARSRDLVQRLYPDAICLGPAHTHVGCPAVFSSVDCDNQRTWTSAHHIGLVLAPKTGELNVYRGPQSELLRALESPAIAPTKPPEVTLKILVEPAPTVVPVAATATSRVSTPASHRMTTAMSIVAVAIVVSLPGVVALVRVRAIAASPPIATTPIATTVATASAAAPIASPIPSAGSTPVCNPPLLCFESRAADEMQEGHVHP